MQAILGPGYNNGILKCERAVPSAYATLGQTYTSNGYLQYSFLSSSPYNWPSSIAEYWYDPATAIYWYFVGYAYGCNRCGG